MKEVKCKSLLYKMHEVICIKIFTLSPTIYPTYCILPIHTLWNMYYKNMVIKNFFTWVNIHYLPILQVASHYMYIEALKIHRNCFTALWQYFKYFSVQIMNTLHTLLTMLKHSFLSKSEKIWAYLYCTKFGRGKCNAHITLFQHFTN